MKFDDLDRRMRSFERSIDQRISDGLFLVARLDGRNFTRLTKDTCPDLAHPFDTPLGPGVVKAPTDAELWTKIYSPDVLSRLDALLRGAEAKVVRESLEARRIALFRREFLLPLLRGNGSHAEARRGGWRRAEGLLSASLREIKNEEDCAL